MVQVAHSAKPASLSFSPCLPPPSAPTSAQVKRPAHSPVLLPPGTQGIDQALAHCAPLQALSLRLRASQSRLDALLPLLPPAMRAHVKAGPIDETGWTLLAANSAVSAKLRQMLPALEAHLRHCGWPGPAVRVKTLSPG